jgi:hypothetical protein
MPKKKPSWQEKLENSRDFPKVEPIPDRMVKNWGTGTLVIPAPIEVAQLMRKVPYGKLTTMTDIRSKLAKKHEATIGCPLTTGIFASIAAHAADEQRQKGKADVTPYWRTLKTDGLFNEKYPGGFDLQKLLLESEGHTVIQKGKKFYVKDYLKAVVSLD